MNEQAEIMKTVELLLTQLDTLPAYERAEVLNGITNRFCVHCGDVQPPHSWRKCQCTNDE